MILPRHRIAELRSLHDSTLALPMTRPGQAGLAHLVAAAIALSEPLAIDEIEPGRAQIVAAKADLLRAVEILLAARAALGSAGDGPAHEAVEQVLARIATCVDNIAGYELHMPLAFELNPLVDWVAQLNQRLDQGRATLAAVRAGLAGPPDARHFDPVVLGRARDAALLGLVDCLTAYERFDRGAGGTVRVLDERAAAARFQGDYDRLDPLALLAGAVRSAPRCLD